MKQLNLLSRDYLSQAQKKRQLPALLLACVVGSMACAGVYFAVKAETAIIQGRSQASDAGVGSGAVANPTKALANQDLGRRINAINNLNKAEVNWSKAFAAIGAIVPKDIVFSGYSLAGGSAATGVVFKGSGEAPSNVSFATFVESIKGNSTLKDVTIDSYSYNSSSGKVTFSVSVTMAFQSLSYSSK